MASPAHQHSAPNTTPPALCNTSCPVSEDTALVDKISSGSVVVNSSKKEKSTKRKRTSTAANTRSRKDAGSGSTDLGGGVADCPAEDNTPETKSTRQTKKKQTKKKKGKKVVKPKKIKKSRARFVMLIFDCLNSEEYKSIVSWYKDAFVIWNRKEFAEIVLPTLFNHNNFSSFERQVNSSFFSFFIDVPLPQIFLYIVSLCILTMCCVRFMHCVYCN